MKVTKAYREFAYLFSRVLMNPDVEESIKPKLDATWDRLTEEQQQYVERLVAEAVARSKASADEP